MIRIWSPKSTKWNGVRCSYSDALLNKISTAVERIAQIHLPLFASLEESHCLLVNWTVRAKRYREPNKDSLDLRDVNVWVQLTDRAVSWDWSQKSKVNWKTEQLSLYISSDLSRDKCKRGEMVETVTAAGHYCWRDPAPAIACIWSWLRKRKFETKNIGVIRPAPDFWHCRH